MKTIPYLLAGVLLYSSAFRSDVSRTTSERQGSFPVITSIPARQWQAALNLQLATLKIRINNYTPTSFRDTTSNTFRWYKKNDCLFQIGMRDQLVRQTFTLLPFRQDPMTIYIQNLNKRVARASAERGKIKVRIEFEQQELEVRTNCVENLACGATGNPNFNIEGPAIEVLLEPVIRSGRISYQNAEVRLFGRLNHEGFNLTVGVLQEIVKMFSFDVNSFIQQEGSRFMQNYLNSPAVVQDLTDKLNMHLERAAAFGFSFPPGMRSVSVDGGGNLVVVHD